MKSKWRLSWKCDDPACERLHVVQDEPEKIAQTAMAFMVRRNPVTFLVQEEIHALIEEMELSETTAADREYAALLHRVWGEHKGGKGHIP